MTPHENRLAASRLYAELIHAGKTQHAARAAVAAEHGSEAARAAAEIHAIVARWAGGWRPPTNP